MKSFKDLFKEALLKRNSVSDQTALLSEINATPRIMSSLVRVEKLPDGFELRVFDETSYVGFKTDSLKTMPDYDSVIDAAVAKLGIEAARIALTSLQFAAIVPSEFQKAVKSSFYNDSDSFIGIPYSTFIKATPITGEAAWKVFKGCVDEGVFDNFVDTVELAPFDFMEFFDTFSASDFTLTDAGLFHHFLNLLMEVDLLAYNTFCNRIVDTWVLSPESEQALATFKKDALQAVDVMSAISYWVDYIERNKMFNVLNVPHIDLGEAFGSSAKSVTAAKKEDPLEVSFCAKGVAFRDKRIKEADGSFKTVAFLNFDDLRMAIHSPARDISDRILDQIIRIRAKVGTEFTFGKATETVLLGSGISCIASVLKPRITASGKPVTPVSKDKILTVLENFGYSVKPSGIKLHLYNLDGMEVKPSEDIEPWYSEIEISGVSFGKGANPAKDLVEDVAKSIGNVIPSSAFSKVDLDGSDWIITINSIDGVLWDLVSPSSAKKVTSAAVTVPKIALNYGFSEEAVNKAASELKFEAVKGNLPMTQGEAIKSFISQFKLPKPYEVAVNGSIYGGSGDLETEDYAFIGIKCKYNNGLATFYFIDTGLSLVPAGHVFEKATQASAAPATGEFEGTQWYLNPSELQLDDSGDLVGSVLVVDPAVDYSFPHDIVFSGKEKTLSVLDYPYLIPNYSEELHNKIEADLKKYYSGLVAKAYSQNQFMVQPAISSKTESGADPWELAGYLTKGKPEQEQIKTNARLEIYADYELGTVFRHGEEYWACEKLPDEPSTFVVYKVTPESAKTFKDSIKEDSNG